MGRFKLASVISLMVLVVLGVTCFLQTAGALVLIAEYNVPTASSHPQEITAGPDGNIWFTENTGNNLRRICGGLACTCGKGRNGPH